MRRFIFSIWLLSINHWLSMRQSLVAGNIANANTPGYKALDLQPFEAVLDGQSADGGHASRATWRPIRYGRDADERGRRRAGHGTSSIPAAMSTSSRRLIKAGDVNRAYSMNTGVMKAFHRMLLSATRPGG